MFIYLLKITARYTMLLSKQNCFPKQSSEKNDIVAFFHNSLMSHRAPCR